MLFRSGSNRLLQDGAKLVMGWTDIVQELPEEWRRMVRGVTLGDPGNAIRPAAQGDEGRLLAQLAPDEPLHIDRLIERTGLPAAQIAPALLALELSGWARQLEGQRWVAVRARPAQGRAV